MKGFQPLNDTYYLLAGGQPTRAKSLGEHFEMPPDPPVEPKVSKSRSVRVPIVARLRSYLGQTAKSLETGEFEIVAEI
jgi:hypothetical protein